MYSVADEVTYLVEQTYLYEHECVSIYLYVFCSWWNDVFVCQRTYVDDYTCVSMDLDRFRCWRHDVFGWTNTCIRVQLCTYVFLYILLLIKWLNELTSDNSCVHAFIIIRIFVRVWTCAFMCMFMHAYMRVSKHLYIFHCYEETMRFNKGSFLDFAGECIHLYIFAENV